MQLVVAQELEDVPCPGTALVEELDRRLLVELRDGRKIVGTLRSFDTFANLVLEAASELVVVGEQFAEKALGLYVVRGENLVLLGQLEERPAEPLPRLQRVSLEEIQRAQRAEREQKRLQKTMRDRFDFLGFDD